MGNVEKDTSLQGSGGSPTLDRCQRDPNADQNLGCKVWRRCAKGLF